MAHFGQGCARVADKIAFALLVRERPDGGTWSEVIVDVREHYMPRDTITGHKVAVIHIAG
jgi:hypothetical protein